MLYVILNKATGCLAYNRLNCSCNAVIVISDKNFSYFYTFLPRQFDIFLAGFTEQYFSLSTTGLS